MLYGVHLAISGNADFCFSQVALMQFSMLVKYSSAETASS